MIKYDRPMIVVCILGIRRRVVVLILDLLCEKELWLVVRYMVEWLLSLKHGCVTGSFTPLLPLPDGERSIFLWKDKFLCYLMMPISCVIMSEVSFVSVHIYILFPLPFKAYLRETVMKADATNAYASAVWHKYSRFYDFLKFRKIRRLRSWFRICCDSTSLCRHWVRSVVCGIGMNNAMNSHQTSLSTFLPNKQQAGKPHFCLIFKELDKVMGVIRLQLMSGKCCVSFLWIKCTRRDRTCILCMWKSIWVLECNAGEGLQGSLLLHFSLSVFRRAYRVGPYKLVGLFIYFCPKVCVHYASRSTGKGEGSTDIESHLRNMAE